MTPNRLIRRAAALLLLFVAWLPLSALADDPVNGAALFASNCSGCHGSSPLTSNNSKIYFGRNARSVIENAIATNNSGMGSLRSNFPSNGSQIADVAAYLGNSPATLSFPATTVGSTAAATQTVTVAASLKGASYAISGLSVAVSGDFARSGGSCGTTVATGTTCTVIVSFTPTAAGTRTGVLNITHSNTLTPIAIVLTGTGTGGTPAAPVATISPATLSLATTAIGATSTAQNISVANTGNAPLVLSSLTLSNPADFVVAGGTCAAGGSVAAGASCTVSIAFQPSAGAVGNRSGTLSIAHNAAGSPGTIALSGTATAAAAPVASLTASLAFGSVNVGATSASQTATLSNTGTAALSIGSLSTGSSEFTLSGGSCAAGGSVAPSASCSIGVSFTPASAGIRSANLVVTHNAAGGQSSASLSGTGLALTPAINVSPLALSFNQPVNTPSAVQTLSVSNTGSAALSLISLSLGGAQASDFQIAPGGSCAAGTSIAPNASCTILISFTPGAIGTRGASLSIAHNAAGSPTTVALNGTGTATAQPAVSLNASSVNFPAQTLGSSSAAQVVVVSNSGAAPLTLATIAVNGTAGSDFGLGGACASGTTLAVGTTCQLSIVFSPSALGARTATLTLASNASNGTAVLSLAGTGAAVPTPAVVLTPATLDFGNQTVGTTSTVRTASLSNSGSGPLSIASVVASTGYSVSHDCGSTLAAGASCTLSVSFAPTASGALAGSVGISSNAAGSPQSLGLSGTGVAASPMLVWVPATPALDFGDLALGAAAAVQTLTLSNQGPGSASLQQITLAGAQASDFSLSSAGTCALNLSLATGASCTVVVAFQPGAVGPRSALLHLASSGTNPPDVTLAGNGTAMAQASITVLPSALTFSLDPAASVADPQQLTLQNSGSASVTVSAARIASGNFTLAAAASNGCAATPFTLLPGQSCALSIGWSGAPASADTGSAEIDYGAGTAPLQVALQVDRVIPPTMSNAGAGGCSIARGDSLMDPVLWLLVLGALAVLWQRHPGRARAAGGVSRPKNPAPDMRHVSPLSIQRKAS